jgi:hypothetical protein
MWLNIGTQLNEKYSIKALSALQMLCSIQLQKSAWQTSTIIVNNIAT